MQAARAAANKRDSYPRALYLRLKTLQRLVAARTRDLVAALGKTGNLERAAFIRGYLKAKGIEPSARELVTSWLDGNLRRVMTENDSYARALAAAGALGDRSAEFAERSRLFRTRGLSSDTSLLPNFAIEESLRALKDMGSIGPASIHRIGIVGPGLDFTDKQDGYDFYPQQSIQPFALADSLVRLGLSKPEELQIVTFDLSPQVKGRKVWIQTAHQTASPGARVKAHGTRRPKRTPTRGMTFAAPPTRYGQLRGVLGPIPPDSRIMTPTS